MSAKRRQFAPDPPQSLREAMDHGKVVPFIGAGISMGAFTDSDVRMPSYKELLRSLQTRIKEDLVSDWTSEVDSLFDALVEKGELMKAADLVDKFVPSILRYRFIRELLNHISPKASRVHEMINILGFPIVLTSNYDRILETSLYPVPEVLTYADDISLAMMRRSQNQAPFVFKIHGEITRPETIILGWERYQDLHNKRDKPDYEALHDFVRSMLAEKTLLFLGCSLQGTEYQEYFMDFVSNHKDRLTPGPHYGLVPKDSLSQEKKDHWYREFGLHVLEYEPDENHSQIWEFLAALKPSTVAPRVPGQFWENFYTLIERPEYLALQHRLESRASSCQFITPSLTNALAEAEYISRHCREKLEKFRRHPLFEGDPVRFADFCARVEQGMLARSENLRKRMSRSGGGCEVRVLFFTSSIDREIKTSGVLARERYRLICRLLEAHSSNFHVRVLDDSTMSQADRDHSSYALVFDEGPERDVALFYAAQATTGDFMTHLVQINTPEVDRRIAHFEKLWAASKSEAETRMVLKAAAGGECLEREEEAH